MKFNNKVPPRYCIVCEARFESPNPFREVCYRPECYRMSKTGETMDDLVREASQMPEDIPDNNHDYDEFDLEDLINQRKDEP
jgi:hypothetical protein